jgi:hypothetical protein
MGSGRCNKNRTFALYRESEDPIVYNFSQPDLTQLILTPVPLPSHYPLLERDFHFVNKWPLER